MENEDGNQITLYTITGNSSASQENIIIANTSMAMNNYPVHEEYKLKNARMEFSSDVDMVCNGVLEDIKIRKMDDLYECEKRDNFLKRSEQMVNELKKRQKAFHEKSNRFLTESTRQLRILNKDCQIIGNEAKEMGNEINMLIRNLKK
ncbi:uncharacterized protein LOC129940436 [Eupeodes corollae]|uniref:uncharacterized protein LOC129940436 n=1 Tax=Eupeodes corollae TaxID=290404 RepID=UPI002491D5D6|nr:uncharacterized protein LOC129940436 [Eupeodes corollae]XP_055904756.1 uncharacterized protein LOC129940436 [Eupeodes corollae]